MENSMTQRAKHYHVTSGLAGGYMPNDVSGLIHTKGEAGQLALQDARNWRLDGDRVFGSLRAGYYYTKDEDGYAHEEIVVSECESQECWEYAEWKCTFDCYLCQKARPAATQNTCAICESDVCDFHTHAGREGETICVLCQSVVDLLDQNADLLTLST